MKDIITACSRIHAMQGIPLSLVDRQGLCLQSWPDILKTSVRREMRAYVTDDFHQQKRDALHPLISYITGGYFVGVVEVRPDLYLIIGLCSPYPHSRKELMELCVDTVFPEYMQQYCDAALQAPVVTLTQMRACIGLLTQLFSGQAVPEDNILFSDSTNLAEDSKKFFSSGRFRQRETAEEHSKRAYELGFCQAIQQGRSDLLLRTLMRSPGGNIGAMSLNRERQMKYTFVSFATLVTRAAIDGGLSEESAYLLSDLYCQRMDILSERSEIDRLTLFMATDFCEKVAQQKLPEQTSPLIRKALNYISVHLHEPFSAEDLASYCGLCRRSLSMRFKEELGIGLVDYVQKEKISEACFLLEHTDLPLSQISFHLNYSSQSYFTSQFKKIVGETPERYRNKRQAHW